MNNSSGTQSLAECYWCGENKGKWCKLCQKAFCEQDHSVSELTYEESEYLSWHQYYNMEFLGVKH